MTATASAPSPNALSTCSGCKRPAHGTAISWLGKGQAKSGVLGRRLIPELGVIPGRAQFSQMKATATGSPPLPCTVLALPGLGVGPTLRLPGGAGSAPVSLMHEPFLL